MGVRKVGRAAGTRCQIAPNFPAVEVPVEMRVAGFRRPSPRLPRDTPSVTRNAGRRVRRLGVQVLVVARPQMAGGEMFSVPIGRLQ